MNTSNELQKHSRFITVDDREVKSGIVPLLEEHGWGVRVQRMASADFQIGQDVFIEKKTGVDFSASVIDGRLFRQVARLRRSKTRIVVLVEGNPYQRDFGIDGEAVRGAVVSLSLIWQVPVIFSESLPQTVEIFGYMADQVYRLTDLPIARTGYRPKRMRRRQLHILQGFPGIGPLRAMRLLKHFGSLRRAFTARPEQWMGVDGIGKAAAGRVADLLDTEFDKECELC
jgi:Fanconi anemia group M protein